MFSQILKELRTENGLSQAQLAKEIGVVQGTIYFWENGINEPTATYLVRLSKFFNVEIEELLGLQHLAQDNQSHLEILKIYNNLSPSKQKMALDILRTIAENK